jgi:hypothetical protein
MLTAEERAMVADMRLQERGGPPPPSPQFMLAPGYIRVPAGMHPDHDDAVVFTPGQLLPGWAGEAFAEQQPKRDRHGVYQLAKPKEVSK